jgi:DNA-binding transcriptional MerR regulator
VTAADFASLKRRANARPNGPEALRLAWLQARAIGSPRKQLLELIAQCRDRGFSIPEIDAYIVEQLANAREHLQRARSEGTMATRTLRVHERTMDLAEAAVHTREDHSMNPLLVRALQVAGQLAEKAEKQPDS